MKTKKLANLSFVILVIFLILLTGCQPAATDTPTEAPATAEVVVATPTAEQIGENAPIQISADINLDPALGPGCQIP
jgi:hypothetical protein